MNPYREAVKTYARVHYEEDGWDRIVECFSNEELDSLIDRENPSSEEDAIEKVREFCKLHHNRYLDILGEVF